MSDGDGGSQSLAATGRTAHLVRRKQRRVSPGVVEPYDPPMTTVHLLHPGYIRSEGSRVGSSISLIRDGDALIVADPGLVAHRRLILDPLAADDGVYALTHAWWRADRTPEIDPYSFDQSVLDQSRSRLLARADVVIPGHGEPFRVSR